MFKELLEELLNENKLEFSQNIYKLGEYINIKNVSNYIEQDDFLEHSSNNTIIMMFSN